MTKKHSAPNPKSWESFEQWKDDVFPNDNSNSKSKPFDFNELAAKAAQQSMAEVAARLHQA